MNIPREIVEYEITPYLPLLDLYSEGWMKDRIFLRELNRRSPTEIMDLLQSIDDPKLVMRVLQVRPEVKPDILEMLIIDRKKNILDELLKEGYKEDILYFPGFYWVTNKDLHQQPLKDVGRTVVQLLQGLEDLELLGRDTIYDLTDVWAEEYQDTYPVIDGVQYDFASDPEYLDPWFIAEEAIFYPEDFRIFNDITDRILIW